MNDSTGSSETLIGSKSTPGTLPARLENVRTNRSLAFMVDAVLIMLLMMLAAVVIGVIGILTLGLGWLLYFILWPAVGLAYYFFTLGLTGATPGMALFGVELRDADGSPPHPVMGIAHPVLFWFAVGITPLYLLSIVVSLMDEKKRMLHDMVLRTLVVRSR